MSEKRYKITVTPFVEQALQEYDDYLRLEAFDDQAADQWIDAFEREMDGLTTFPAKFRLMNKEPWHSAGVRIRSIKGRNIYYWISEERQKVYVIDVISEKMNQDKRLTESIIALYKELAQE